MPAMTNLDPKPAVTLLEVDAEQHGQRIDNFLLRTLKGVPKSRVYRILRKGEVRVNKGRIKPDYRLQTGDVVRLPPIRVAEREPDSPPPTALLESLGKAVLYEDHELIVIDKPSGLAVHKGSGLRYGLIEALRFMRPQQTGLELAHRLDRETSGCLIVTKTAHALRQVQDTLKTGQLKKRYLTLVCGQWDFGEQEINLPLRKNALRGGERIVVVSEDGKPARSRFKPVSLWPQASLLEVSIATGRTHQIRVHAASAGHPVAGDEKYGDSESNRILRQHGLRRLFLHAQSVNIILGDRDIFVDAPLPEELKQILDLLETR